MKCINQLKAKAALIGATIDEDSLNNGILILDAPMGYVWQGSGEPSFSDTCGNRSQTWFTEACRYVERNNGGLRKVTDPEELARIRWDQDNDTWGAPAGAPKTIEWPK